MKRFIALLLVVVIAATALSISAFAYGTSRSGDYNGKRWNASLYVTGSYVKSSFTIPSSGITRIDTTTRVFFLNNPSNKFPYTESVSSDNGSVSGYINLLDLGVIGTSQAHMTFRFKSLSGTLYV